MTEINQPAKAIKNNPEEQNWWESPAIREEMNLEICGSTRAVGYVEIYVPHSIISPNSANNMKVQARAILLDLADSMTDPKA